MSPLIFVSLLGFATPALASDPAGSTAPAADHAAEAKAAEAAALSWLALVDAGQYDASLSDAAAFFRGAVTPAQWTQAMQSTRKPLGTVSSRTLKSATYATSLPGAPDGRYVVVQFDTTFSNKAAAVETITPMREPDGVWRTSGYFIK